MVDRVLICGGRDYADYGIFIRHMIDLEHQHGPFSVVIQGGALGADRCAKLWAANNDIMCEEYLADWNRDGRAAGPIRNQRMLDQGKPKLVIAFPGGRGTADMVRRAKLAGVPVVNV